VPLSDLVVRDGALTGGPWRLHALWCRYILEGKELDFYQRQLAKKKKTHKA
jgi:hypothetical protein